MMKEPFPPEITEGEAFSADGTLLYRIEPTETIEDGETYTTYEWMPVK